MSHTYCIWYRVREAQDREAETAVRALQARLGCRTGVAGRLLKKRDAPDTWMELYDGVSDARAFERELQALVAQYDVEMFAADSRHVECFEDDAPGRPACREND